MGELMDRFEAECKERNRRRAAGLPLEPVEVAERTRRREAGAPALVPVERSRAHVHVERPGIDMSIPRGEREPGEEG
jgi:hypothetical protein